MWIFVIYYLLFYLDPIRLIITMRTLHWISDQLITSIHQAHRQSHLESNNRQKNYRGRGGAELVISFLDLTCEAAELPIDYRAWLRWLKIIFSSKLPLVNDSAMTCFGAMLPNIRRYCLIVCIEWKENSFLLRNWLEQKEKKTLIFFFNFRDFGKFFSDQFTTSRIYFV